MQQQLAIILEPTQLMWIYSFNYTLILTDCPIYDGYIEVVT